MLNHGKMISINVEAKGPAWSREQRTRCQRHSVTLSASLSPFPRNPVWVKKQGKRLRRKGESEMKANKLKV